MRTKDSFISHLKLVPIQMFTISIVALVISLFAEMPFILNLSIATLIVFILAYLKVIKFSN